MAEKVIMPKLEMTQETGKLIEWLKDEGEQVEKGETLFVIETDKVTVEIDAPASGILSGIQAFPGDDVPISTTIAYLLEPGEKLSEVEAEIGPSPGTVPEGQVIASLAALRLAQEKGIDLVSVQGSGPQGRIEIEDVEQVVPLILQVKADKVIPLEGMRRTIADRMMMSYQTIPHIAFTVRVDMGNVEMAREKVNDEAHAHGLSRVSITTFLVMAVARNYILTNL